ncbi:hypothetical protein [Deinococcus aquiradiocola]|uniref:hypothetical protein n=1 Tax=Deinococcus aquiradiocola TaxID=393059 RepID=UPI00166399BB|nr:hypothetical protein [Deinococcus aquiradiocola]
MTQKPTTDEHHEPATSHASASERPAPRPRWPDRLLRLLSFAFWAALIGSFFDS